VNLEGRSLRCRQTERNEEVRIEMRKEKSYRTEDFDSGQQRGKTPPRSNKEKEGEKMTNGSEHYKQRKWSKSLKTEQHQRHKRGGQGEEGQ